jgi:Bacterial regulatory helix-turn-helix protein, lysR family
VCFDKRAVGHDYVTHIVGYIVRSAIYSLTNSLSFDKDRRACRDADQLTAFAAVIESGSFDAAAERLHVTPSDAADLHGTERVSMRRQRLGQFRAPDQLEQNH